MLVKLLCLRFIDTTYDFAFEKYTDFYDYRSAQYKFLDFLYYS